jgi:PadR family transcriptional regulator PadR
LLPILFSIDAYSDFCILSLLSMRKTDSLQGSLDLMVLKILSRRPQLHGYAIMTAIEEMSQEVLRVEEGSLYPALHRMEEAAWIRAEWITKDNGRRARIYSLTQQGADQLAAEESRWEAVTSAVNRVLRMA